jgi:2-dehydropantoate 2-reductase
VRLALAGHETAAVARGATLAALREHGWRLSSGERAPVRATDTPADLGAQDLVVLAVKAPALPAVAARIGPLLRADTVVTPAMNGVPWWFLRDTPLRSVDPDGAIAAAIPRRHVLGCVVHLDSTAPEPGVGAHARHRHPPRPDPAQRPRARPVPRQHPRRLDAPTRRAAPPVRVPA